jgi:hypothetical protein
MSDEPDVLAYVKASHALHVKLYGDLYAVSLPGQRASDRPAAAGEVEDGNRTAADDVSARGLRNATELPTPQPRVLAGASEGDQAQGRAAGDARSATAAGELEIQRAMKGGR